MVPCWTPLADICGAVQQVLLEHVSERLPFAYLKSFVGFHLDAVFTDILPNSNREQLDELIRRYKATYLAREHTLTHTRTHTHTHTHTHTNLFPWVAEALPQKPRRA